MGKNPINTSDGETNNHKVKKKELERREKNRSERVKENRKSISRFLFQFKCIHIPYK